MNIFIAFNSLDSPPRRRKWNLDHHVTVRSISQIYFTHHLLLLIVENFESIFLVEKVSTMGPGACEMAQLAQQWRSGKYFVFLRVAAHGHAVAAHGHAACVPL
jgi:hypothetical protein